LGFKDLSAFNLAMLGKDGNSCQNPTLLCLTFLKRGTSPTSLTLQQPSGTIQVMCGEAFSGLALLFAAERVGVLVQVTIFLSLMNLGCAMVTVSMGI